MIPIVILSIIFLLLLFIKVKTARLRISLLLGFFISIFSFFALIVLLFIPSRAILAPLLGIFYTSIIAFLILWNKVQTKKVYYMLVVPFVCIASAVGVIAYFNAIYQIPTVNERQYSLYDYRPFMRNNVLAKLDEDSNFQIVDKLPFLDGATALYPVYASFTQAVYPEGEYNHSQGPVYCNTTEQAFINLFEGKAEIIFCAEPSEMQLAAFLDNGINIQLIPIGKEAFVFFVHNRNPVSNLSIEHIQGIYSGRITNWRELNGPRQRIRAFQRPSNSGSQTMLVKIMGGIPVMRPRMENVASGMGDIISEIAVYRNFTNAIGYSFLHFTTVMVNNEQIKLLSIDDVNPSAQSIIDNSYPFSGYFYAIYVDREDKNENIEPFIEWILSRQGQALVAMTGYVPVIAESAVNLP